MKQQPQEWWPEAEKPNHQIDDWLIDDGMHGIISLIDKQMIDWQSNALLIAEYLEGALYDTPVIIIRRKITIHWQNRLLTERRNEYVGK